MKTQLLEDIGESATLSIEPSGRVSNSGVQKERQDIAQAPVAAPVRPRSAFGVWRQKPEGEPLVEMEAQHVPSPPVPEVAPVLAAEAVQSAPVAQGPVFDFTLPPPTTPAPGMPQREPSWFARSGRRYLLWGSCVLAGALVVQLGWWSYDERQDAGTPVVAADEMKVAPQVGKAPKRRALGAKEFTLGPDGDVQAAPAASPTPVERTAPTIPPLVLLTPEPPTDIKLAQPQPVAVQTPTAPATKGLHRTVSELPVPVARPVRAKVERAPERRLASEPFAPAEKKPEPESTASATLKACKEHGYTAAQCVKQACSMTKYGFVCRGK